MESKTNPAMILLTLIRQQLLPEIQTELLSMTKATSA
jgi:hypothetical protein